MLFLTAIAGEDNANAKGDINLWQQQYPFSLFRLIFYFCQRHISLPNHTSLMKAKFTLVVALMATFFSGFSQQIPNGSFETWTDKYTPAGWASVDDILSTVMVDTTGIFTVRDTTTFTQGRTSIKLITDTVGGALAQYVGVEPGVISLGTATLDLSIPAPVFTGIAFGYRPDSLIFDYKQTSAGSDSGGFNLTLTNKTVNLIGDATYGFSARLHIDTAWTHVALALAPYYISNAYPDTLLIQFASSDPNSPVVGTTLNVDGVRFGYVGQPLAVATSGATALCTGDSVTFTATAGGSSNFTYQWKLAGAPIAGATQASYTAKDTGAYTVTIDSAGLTTTSQTLLVTKATGCNTGISNVTAAEFSVYPNPATTVLNINSNQHIAGFNLQVYDVVGRLVISQVLTDSNNAVNVALLANGTYIYRIADKQNEVVTQRKFNVIK